MEDTARHPLVGRTATQSMTVDARVVADFAKATGDHNPLHLDEEFASRTRFGRCIAHGMIGASLISAVIGNQLPGHGTVYLKQELAFKRPVFIGDEITARVEVAEKLPKKHAFRLVTTVSNAAGEVVIDGAAEVYFKYQNKSEGEA